jgi:hypothetical protein
VEISINLGFFRLGKARNCSGTPRRRYSDDIDIKKFRFKPLFGTTWNCEDARAAARAVLRRSVRRGAATDNLYFVHRCETIINSSSGWSTPVSLAVILPSVTLLSHRNEVWSDVGVRGVLISIAALLGCQIACAFQSGVVSIAFSVSAAWNRA